MCSAPILTSILTIYSGIQNRGDFFWSGGTDSTASRIKLNYKNTILFFLSLPININISLVAIWHAHVKEMSWYGRPQKEKKNWQTPPPHKTSNWTENILLVASYACNTPHPESSCKMCIKSCVQVFISVNIPVNVQKHQKDNNFLWTYKQRLSFYCCLFADIKYPWILNDNLNQWLIYSRRSI